MVELLEDDGHLAANDRDTPLPPLSADNRASSSNMTPQPGIAAFNRTRDTALLTILGPAFFQNKVVGGNKI